MVLMVAALSTSCRYNRNITYFTEVERDEAKEIINIYNSVVLPGDNLHIYVSSNTPESVVAFNEETNGTMSLGLSDKQDSCIGYTVSGSGAIRFPFLGKIHVAGYTLDSLELVLQAMLVDSGLVKDPVVDVTLTNFRVTVLGEVKHPQQLHPDGMRLTVLEALAMCGDLTVDGVRDSITVLRTTARGQVIGTISLTDSSMFDSPYYYLQQNDIVYVEPSERKKRIAARDPNLPRYVTIGVSVASMLGTMYRAIVTDARYNR